MKPVCRRKFFVDYQLAYDENLRVGEDFVLFAESLFNRAKVIRFDVKFRPILAVGEDNCRIVLLGPCFSSTVVMT